MALVARKDIESLIPKGMLVALSSDAVFAKIEAEASRIVRDRTGITIPDDLADRPDWCVVPMAWIICKVGEGLVDQSDTTQKTVDHNFGEAMKLLDQHRAKPAVPSNAIMGRKVITGDTSW